MCSSTELHVSQQTLKCICPLFSGKNLNFKRLVYSGTFLVLLLLPPVFSDCFCSQYDIFADCGGTEASPIIFILPWFPVLSLGDFHQYLEFFIHGLAISVFCDEIETELERIVLPLRQSLFFSSGCRTINFLY